MSKKRQYSVPEQIACFTILGILFWCWGLGFVSFLLWGLMLAALVPERWWPKTRFQKEVEAKVAENLTARIKADKRTARVQAMRDWDREFYRLQYPTLTDRQIAQKRNEIATQAVLARVRASAEKARNR
ncbi:MAG: hypothetical protein ACTHJ9_00625 [Rhodanobacter sp.]